VVLLLLGACRRASSPNQRPQQAGSSNANASLDNVKDVFDPRLHPGATVIHPLDPHRLTESQLKFAGIMKTVGKSPLPKKRRPFYSEAEIYFIDDPSHPLVLLWRSKDPLLNGGRSRIGVVKIEYKVPQPINLVEKQLAERERAITYGTYFDFNKYTIKPEPDPVLKQIVFALKDHADWKLTVNGNNDNIGGDAYNQDLSKRRAGAVKQTLIGGFHIGPDRLSTNGYGSSGPIDINDTLDGRAHNRRVELTRE